MHLPQDPEKIFEKAFVEDVAVFVANGNFGKDAELAQPIEPLYAIQAYISSGIKYPQTNGEFEKETPEATYEVITQVLPKLYMNTRKTLTSVSKSCHKFKEEALDGLLFYPKIISSYCENALDALESKESGLVQQLKVLTDTKYDKVTPGEEDNDFNDAKELAIFSLGEMQIQAEKHKQSISDLKQKVTEFKAETDSNRGMAKDLDATYSQKVLVEGNSYESVLDFVGGQLKGMEEKLNTANERYEEAYDQEVSVINNSSPSWLTRFSTPPGSREGSYPVHILEERTV
ncbi:hypothetical protein BGW36DRAFT_22474 [Talaromyces proteolyticus]|uniref:Uncharacterized protein n=1 Tax=Talaromyces proteolyticus TaxID=1131652 RepID=A0AAD4L4Z8_9EURO|nr:uncharacterized protein BGW36DRAFT_22474 [Talaromyces proteolyticus]KAH8706072.1 hypothetical protein BGW36DRAFT_22474 [Talaromyces proteolyticus]